MTKHETQVVTHDQHIIPADEKIAAILGIDVGADVNCRTVKLMSGEIPYVYARSLSPLERMPDEVRQDMLRADIPIGKILRNHDIETRRDFDSIEIKDKSLYGADSVLSRSYKIVHEGDVLMWINEQFPIDSRWEL